MIGQIKENFTRDDRGATLVEVMVAFIVLMIVIAMFTGATDSASAAVTNSIDIRRSSDNEYEAYRKELTKHTRDNTYVSPMETGLTNNVSVTLIDGSAKDITAYQYKSGDSVYWVFR